MKRVVFLGIMIVSFAQLALAQSRGASAVMSVSITIIRPNTISQATPINVTMSPTQKTQTISSYNSKAGSFSISGIPDSNVLISFPQKVRLENSSGKNTIINPVTPVYNSSDNQKRAQRFYSDRGGVITLPKSGLVHVWVGSKFNNAKKMSGTYKGVYTTTIEYLN